MDLFSRVLDTIRTAVRKCLHQVARVLNRLSGGHLTPNNITIVGLLGHLPVAWLIATNHLLLGAIFLVIFGLMDTLDGQLAKLQNSASKKGMFLDSVTDRLKEVLLYVGISYYFVAVGKPYLAVWATAACGVAVTISYLNAWGEVVTADTQAKQYKPNQTFRGGLLSYDLRIFLLVVGLGFNQLPVIVVVISVLGLITCAQRINNILQRLDV
jgi:phosphatidylglycerophosphate synthase